MIVAITPTGGRPYQFALCEKYMARQTVKPDLWIVVDDVASGDDCVRADWHSLHRIELRPKPSWIPSMGNTQHRNLMAAMDYVISLDVDESGASKFLIFEDDDHVAPDHIATISTALDSFDLAGTGPARYWHTKHQACRVFSDAPNPSLAATGFNAAVIPLFLEILKSGEWIDSALWRRWTGTRTKIKAYTVTGIKGLPGRPGVSSAHRNEPGPGWIGDTGGPMLRRWVGEDAAPYLHPPQPEEELPQPDLTCMLKWHRGPGGQVRYHCPSCPMDHFSPDHIAIHWEKEHRAEEDPLGMGDGSNLFGPDDKPLGKVTAPK